MRLSDSPDVITICSYDNNNDLTVLLETIKEKGKNVYVIVIADHISDTLKEVFLYNTAFTYVPRSPADIDHLDEILQQALLDERFSSKRY